MLSNQTLRIAMLTVMILSVSSSITHAGGGLFSRLRSAQPSSSSRSEPSAPQRSTTRGSLGSGGSPSRLPSGRNYYQGRYYGNVNNRFYGPQYGYF